MIFEDEPGAGFEVACDICQRTAGERFVSFMEGVRYIRKQNNRWRRVMDSGGERHDLCPECNTPGIVDRLRGFTPGPSAAELAREAAEDDEEWSEVKGGKRK